MTRFHTHNAIENINKLFYAELNDGAVVKYKGNIQKYYADIISKIIKQTKSKSFLEVGQSDAI